MPDCEVCGGVVDVDADEGAHYSCLGIEPPRCPTHGEVQDADGACPACYLEVPDGR